MSISIGDSGKTAAGTLKTYNFSYPAPREDLLGSALTLPTTEPASPQVSYTVQASDLPTITPAPRSVKYTVSVITAGRITTSGIISYRILKNGASVITASTASIAANNYYTETHWRWFDVQVGDVLEVKLWSSVADSTYDYSAITCYITQLVLTPNNIVLKDYNITVTAPPNLVLGNPSLSNTGNMAGYPVGGGSTVSYGHGIGSFYYPFMYNNPNWGLFRLSSGDAALTTFHQIGGAQRPTYQKMSQPSVITFREMLR